MKINPNPTSNTKIIYGTTNENSHLESNLPDEKLKRLLRRAVKNVRVPADFESRLMTLIARQS